MTDKLPKGFTLTLKGEHAVRVFINEDDMKALRKMGKTLALVDAEGATGVVAEGGSDYIQCSDGNIDRRR